jgi:hypothetical protein
MNPAALSAIARGGLANALVASTPGGIQRQEAQGQRDMIASTHLPKEIRGATREQLEGIGFVFGADVDELFVNVTLPAGWTKNATDHSMWSDLKDEKGRKRGGIFYKAAFYDRRADMRLDCRYSVQACGDGPGPNESSVQVMDGDALLKDFGVYNRRADKYWELCEKLEAEARAWLDAEFPDNRNALAYWD